MMNIKTQKKYFSEIAPGDIWIQSYFGGTLGRIITSIMKIEDYKKSSFYTEDFNLPHEEDWIFVSYLFLGEHEWYTSKIYNFDFFQIDSKLEILV